MSCTVLLREPTCNSHRTSQQILLLRSDKEPDADQGKCVVFNVQGSVARSSEGCSTKTLGKRKVKTKRQMCKGTREQARIVVEVHKEKVINKRADRQQIRRGRQKSKV